MFCLENWRFTNLSTKILEVECWLDLTIPNIVRQLSNSIVNKHIIGKIAQNTIWQITIVYTLFFDAKI